MRSSIGFRQCGWGEGAGALVLYNNPNFLEGRLHHATREKVFMNKDQSRSGSEGRGEMKVLTHAPPLSPCLFFRDAGPDKR